MVPPDLLKEMVKNAGPMLMDLPYPKAALDALSAEVARLQVALRALASYALTADTRESSQEWLIGLVGKINLACEALGETDRFTVAGNYHQRIVKVQPDPAAERGVQ